MLTVLSFSKILGHVTLEKEMKKLNRKLLVAGVLSALSSGVYAADSSVAYNAAVTTDYRFRGISQSASDPAISGGVDFSTTDGLYLGAWGSTIDFDGDVD